MRKPRRFTYDPAKDARNTIERGLSFEASRNFEFETTVIAVDDRRDYGELREVAISFLGARMRVLIFTTGGMHVT